MRQGPSIFGPEPDDKKRSGRGDKEKSSDARGQRKIKKDDAIQGMAIVFEVDLHQKMCRVFQKRHLRKL